jgi:hypothetical protein
VPVIGTKSNYLICLAKLVGFGGYFCQGVTNLVKIYFEVNYPVISCKMSSILVFDHEK